MHMDRSRLSPFAHAPACLYPHRATGPLEGSQESALRSSECKVYVAVPWDQGRAGQVCRMLAVWPGELLSLASMVPHLQTIPVRCVSCHSSLV